jgi:hypothetical protein
MTGNELLDFLINRGCRVVAHAAINVQVACGACTAIFPGGNDELTTRTQNDIERQLEPCLGSRWLPI